MIDQLKIDFEKILKKSDFSKNNVNFKKTLSCYNPIGITSCGECDACLIRTKGFSEANIKDPLTYMK